MHATDIELPSLYCPIPPAIHPQAEEIEQRAIAWVDEIGLYLNATERAWGLATRSSDFSCRVLADGDHRAVALFARWNYLAFALDDWHDSGQATTSTATVVDFNWRVIRALETGDRLHETDQFTTALNDLVARTRAMTSPAQLRRLADGTRDWLFGAAWQTSCTERRIMPTLAEYTAVRPSVNGTRFSLAWVEIADQFDVPAPQWASAPMQTLFDTAGFVVSIDNDLIGYAKDDHLEVLEPNIVNLLARHHGYPFDRAVTESAVIRDRAMHRYLHVRNQLAITHPNLHRYLNAIDHYTRGALDWMSTAPRYASPRNRHELPTPDATVNVSVRNVP